MNQNTPACYAKAEAVGNRPPSQVESKQGYIDDCIARLEQSVRQVFDRLQPVLSPGVPVTNKDEEKIAEMLVPVAQRSHDQARAIQRIEDNMNELLRRLAV